MPQVANINAVSIVLEVDGKQALFIMLAKDGTINRLGSGAVDNQDNDMFIGLTKDPLFDRLMTQLDDGMLDHMGGYDVPDPKGALCRLSIGLSFNDANDNGFGFSYGSESQGPPPEIGNFVTEAVKLTNSWFEDQKRMVGKAKSGSAKPWWKFW